MGFKAFILAVALFVLAGASQFSWAQELDDVEAEMDTVLSESDAAKSAEEYTRKRRAEEKEKVIQAEKEANEKIVEAQNVKEASISKITELEKDTAKFVSERKIFDARTKKLNEQIAYHEGLVKKAEDKLNLEKEQTRIVIEQHAAAKEILAQKKSELAKLEEERKAVLAEKKKAKRELASVARSMPGKKINMAKDCVVHSEMSKESPAVGTMKKGNKVSLAKVSRDGWFYAKGASLKGFIHKTCE